MLAGGVHASGGSALPDVCALSSKEEDGEADVFEPTKALMSPLSALCGLGSVGSVQPAVVCFLLLAIHWNRRGTAATDSKKWQRKGDALKFMMPWQSAPIRGIRGFNGGLWEKDQNEHKLVVATLAVRPKTTGAFRGRGIGGDGVPHARAYLENLKSKKNIDVR